MTGAPGTSRKVARSAETCTSMTFEVPSQAQSQTCSMIWSRVTSWPCLRTSSSRMAKARPVMGNGRPPTPTRLRGRVKAHHAGDQDAGPFELSAAQQRSQPGIELVDGEGLGKVVVGTGIEAPNTFGDSAMCGQHQDGRPHTLVPKPGAQVDAVSVGQADIEDDARRRELRAPSSDHPRRSRRHPPRNLRSAVRRPAERSDAGRPRPGGCASVTSVAPGDGSWHRPRKLSGGACCFRGHLAPLLPQG